MKLKMPFLPPEYEINIGFNARGIQDNSGDIDVVRKGWEVGNDYPEALVAWIPNPDGATTVELKHRRKDGLVFEKTICNSQQEALDLIALRLCLGISGEET